MANHVCDVAQKYFFSWMDENLILKWVKISFLFCVRGKSRIRLNHMANHDLTCRHQFLIANEGLGPTFCSFFLFMDWLVEETICRAHMNHHMLVRCPSKPITYNHPTPVSHLCQDDEIRSQPHGCIPNAFVAN